MRSADAFGDRASTRHYGCWLIRDDVPGCGRGQSNIARLHSQFEQTLRLRYGLRPTTRDRRECKVSEIGVGLVGYKFMGRAHSNAYRQVGHFFDVDPHPRMVAICGRDEFGVKEAAEKLGWEGYETDYHALVVRPDIQLVDVSTPGDTHKDVVLAALAAGKHVICEKPLANNLAEAREMLQAARNSGAIAIVNYNYRKVPAVQFAKKLIDDGAIGEVRHWRAVYLQDWITDPNFPLVWRLKKELAGSGALGDIAAHITDLGLYLVGPISEVVGTMSTFIKERAVARGWWPSPARRWVRSPSTTRPRSWRASRAAPLARSKRRGWRPDGVTSTASRSTGRRGRSS